MGRSRKTAPATDEFPLLTQNNLKAINTLGDGQYRISAFVNYNPSSAEVPSTHLVHSIGNCLFNALSDQMYGNKDKQSEIRANVISYMRAHADDFRPFCCVGPTRRNPKRKNVGVTSVDAAAPTAAELERAFQARLSDMARGGTWGDNHEVAAFAKAYKMDVTVWQTSWKEEFPAAWDDVARPQLHIAFHDYGHYSSVRNMDGPLTGLPSIRYVDKEKASRMDKSEVKEWMIKAVTTSLPTYVDEQVIRKTLQMCNCSVSDTVSKLIEDSESYPSSPASTMSRSGNSSIARGSDSDDEEIYGPNKRRNRKILATKQPAGKGTKTGNTSAPKSLKSESQEASSSSSCSPSPAPASPSPPATPRSPASSFSTTSSSPSVDDSKKDGETSNKSEIKDKLDTSPSPKLERAKGKVASLPIRSKNDTTSVPIEQMTPTKSLNVIKIIPPEKTTD
ncbi:OTU-like cysteine protease protein [Rutstroemia sp. NJR-2017a BBW]|nr:OTU-like cysteine protease protein [Rutstroemia sp. NJR-2017a BBW]